VLTGGGPAPILSKLLLYFHFKIQSLTLKEDDVRITRPGKGSAAAITCCLLILLSFAAPAVTVIECVDAQGRHSFQDHCPTGSHKLRALKILAEKKKADQAPDLGKLAAEHPLTLYAVPQCDACDLVRAYLNKRQIPFTERDASTDVAVQADLKKLAGSLTVPVLSLDDQVIKGYNTQLMETALSAVGYPTKPAPEGTAEPAPPVPPPPPPPPAP